jgi:GT2 family glycosyltransferase
VLRAAHVRTLEVDPPGPFAQTANIVYPRTVLEAEDGFDEALPTAAGEDTDLALRARRSGTRYLGAAEAVVNHAVEAYSLPGMIRLSWKWRHLPRVVKRHPGLRELYPLSLFWRRSHLLLVVGTAGVVLSPRTRVAGALALPYARDLLRRRGTHLRGRVRATIEAPGKLAIDAVELAALIWGSAKHRTLFL